MKKTFVAIFMVATALFSATNKEVEEYISATLKNNKSITVKNVKVISKEAIKEKDLSGWESMIVGIEVEVDRKGKKQQVKTTDMYFTKGDFLSPDIIDVKKNKSLKESLRPKPTAEYYDANHLVAGNKDAKYKVLVFSDPLCPFCRDLVPDLIEAATKHPSKIALYHYTFPLLFIHPSSDAIARTEIAIGSKIQKAKLLSLLYKTDVEPEESDEEKITAKLSSELGVTVKKSDISKKEIQKAYEDEVQKAHKLFVKGTPTVYVNNELDGSKTQINKILKELSK